MQNLQTRPKRTRMGAVTPARPLAAGQGLTGDGSLRRTIIRNDGGVETGGPCSKDRFWIPWGCEPPKRRITQLLMSNRFRKRRNRSRRLLRPAKTGAPKHWRSVTVRRSPKESDSPFSQYHRVNCRLPGYGRSTGQRQSVGAPAACSISMAAGMCVPMVSIPWESSPGTTSIPISMACFNMGADR